MDPKIYRLVKNENVLPFLTEIPVCATNVCEYIDY